MEVKNVIGGLVCVILLGFIIQNVSAISFETINYDTEFQYIVSLTLKFNSTYAKIYVQDNVTLKTEQMDMSGFSELPTKYSGHYR